MVRRSARWIGSVALLLLANAVLQAGISTTDRRLLDLFGDIFARVRSDYVDEARTEPWRLIDAAAQGLLKSGENESRLDELKSIRTRYWERSKGTSAYDALGYFGDLFERSLSKEAGTGNNETLMMAAIAQMVAALDPLSSYISAKEFRDLQVQTRGSFGAPGLEIAKQGEAIRVARPIRGSQAEKAGLMCGDVITAVDGINVAQLELNRVVEKLRGPVGSKVTLSILAPGRPRPFDVTIERKVVYTPLVEYSVQGDIGYVRIWRFAEQTKDQLQQALAVIKAQTGTARLKGYVVDLRDNTGGLLDAIIDAADLFLDRGEIVSVRGRDGAAQKRYGARPGDAAAGKPIVLLVNGRTASGAEMFAASLQDHRRARIVGTRTHGDAGTIQTIIPLGAGNGALRLTTERMYSPRGRSIAGGIAPDFEYVHPASAGIADAREGCQSAGGDIAGDVQLQYAAKVLRDNVR